VPPLPTAAIFLHASRSLESVRLCFGTAAGVPAVQPFPSDNEMPGSNYPGIAVGGAVQLPDLSLVSDGATVYAVRAFPIAGLIVKNQPATCQDLICAPNSGPACLTEKLDYWRVDTIAQPAPAQTTLFAVAGCLGNGNDPLANSARCGPFYDPVMGNLHLETVPLGLNVPIEDGGLQVQAAQLSPGLASLQGDAGTTALSFGDMADAQTVAQLGAEGTVVPTSMLPTPPPGLAAFGQVGFAVVVQGVDGGSAGDLWMSLAQSQELVDPAQDPTVYYAGGRFVVAVVGDPFAPHAFMGGDGGYDGTGLHLLVLPAGATMP
jgi:hypothetical protein